MQKTLCLVALLLTPLCVSAQHSPANTLTADEVTDGWKLLFDGRTTAGWRLYGGKDAGDWSVRNGMLVSGRGDLMTREKYVNFILSVDWQPFEGRSCAP